MKPNFTLDGPRSALQVTQFGALGVTLTIVALTVGVWSSIGYADVHPNPYLGLGFFPLNASGLPVPVVAAGESTFKLIVLEVLEAEDYVSYDISGGKSEVLKSTFKNQYAEPYLTVYDKQVERCERGSIEMQKDCRITFDVGQGTGFLALNGSTLWTNMHVIDRQLESVEKYYHITRDEQLNSKSLLTIFIFDKDGKLVVDPYLNPIAPKFIPKTHYERNHRAGVYADDSDDYVGLALSKSIGKPLPISVAEVTAGATIYTLGYPHCTGCGVKDPDFQDRTPAPNSDGKSLRVSVGQVLTSANLSDGLMLKYRNLHLPIETNVYYCSAESIVGMSGGPALNERGEVLAFHSSGGSEILTDGRYSVLVRPPEFAK